MSFTPEISDYLATLRSEIDTALELFSRPRNGCPRLLGEAMRYSLLAPGKRFRPTLTLLACELCGGERTRALPAACAVEMIHAYSLIHDDLPAMDDDDLRRGRATCHVEYGEATAILAGDALQSLAFQILVQPDLPPSIAARCVAVLAEAAGPVGMVGGQADDMLEAQGFQPQEPDRWILEVHRRKTGALIRAALELGATVAGVSPKQLETLVEFGELLGLVFQITDDLLDWVGEERQMGKRLRKDADHHKLTYPIVFGLERARAEAVATTEAACRVLEPFQTDSGGTVHAEQHPAYEALAAYTRYLLERKS